MSSLHLQYVFVYRSFYAVCMESSAVYVRNVLLYVADQNVNVLLVATSPLQEGLSCGCCIPAT